LAGDGVEGLRQNAGVAAVVQHMEQQRQQHNKEHTNEKQCEICEGERAVEVFCYNCKDEMCMPCFKTFHAPRLFRDHKYGPVGNKVQVLCQDHSKEMDLFCDTCSKCVCYDCFFKGSCQSHHVEPVNKVEDKHRQELQHCVQQLAKLQDSIVSHVAHVDKLMNETNESWITTTNTIERIMSQLIDCIETHQHILLHKIHQQREAKIKTLDMHKEHLVMMRRCVQVMATTCAELAAHDVHQADQSQQKGKTTATGMPHTAGEYITQSRSCVTHAKAVISQTMHVCDGSVDTIPHMLGGLSAAVGGEQFSGGLQKECEAMQVKVNQMAEGFAALVDVTQTKAI